MNSTTHHGQVASCGWVKVTYRYAGVVKVSLTLHSFLAGMTLISEAVGVANDGSEFIFRIE